MATGTYQEIWKEIPNYEGLYFASNLGNIKNANGKYLKPNKTKKGYYHTTLYKDHVPKTFKWHRIIAISFLGIDPNNPQINHKNGVKTDNRLENLEWCTHSHNQRHAYDTGLNIPKRGEDSHLYGSVRGKSCRAKIVLDTNYGIFYDCAKDAADVFGLTYNQLKNRLRGITPNNTALTYV